MPQDSLDHEEVVKGPPESGVDLTEQLRQLDLAREDDTTDIQLQSDIDRSATDLERLVTGQEALPRGKRDEVDGLIPRMMRHGGIIQKDGHVTMAAPPPYPGSHPYLRPSPQQRSSPPQSQQQLWHHHQRQHQQQPVRSEQRHMCGPQVFQDNFHLYGVSSPGSTRNVHQQNLHPERHAMNLGIQEPCQTLPPPYPGGAPAGTPTRLDDTPKDLELSETDRVNLDDILSILRHDLETDGASLPQRSIPYMETAADKCGSILKNGQSDWLQNTSHSSSRSSPPQVVPNSDDITSQMLRSSCSTSNSDHEFLFQGGESGSLQYPRCSDAPPMTWPHSSSNHSSYLSARSSGTANSPAYPPTVPYHPSNSSCLSFFEDISAPNTDLLRYPRTDSPDFRQQNTGFNQSRVFLQRSKDRDSLLDHGTMVKTANSGQQPFGFLPVQNGACRGGAAVCLPKQERFLLEQNKAICGEASVFKPPQDAFSMDQDKALCGGAPAFRGPPEMFSSDQHQALCGGAPAFQGPPGTFSADRDQEPCGGVPGFQGPPQTFSEDQDQASCGGAPAFQGPPETFSADQGQAPSGRASVFQGPPERFTNIQNNPSFVQDQVFPSGPDKLSPGQDGRRTNPGEARGGSPCPSASSHHSPLGPSPACSPEYSNDEDEDEDVCHEEDTVVHYFADLGIQQVKEIYADNKQLVQSNVNKLNHQRQTALYIAVMLRKYDIVYFLLQIGADPNIQCVELRSDTMQAPLHKAIELGDTQMVLLLLADEGLDIELQRVCDKKTPLMLALHGHIPGNEERDRREIIHHLLDFGACSNKFNESSDKTVLMMAIETRDVGLIEHFLDNVGVERSRDLINRANKVGNTSLHIAAGMKMLDRAEHLHLLTMLIHFGGNTDAANQDLKTPKDWKRNLFDEIKRQHLTYQSRY